MNQENTLQISYSLAELEQVVHCFWQYAHTYRIIAFDGAMGTGKTTFCRALAQHIGVSDELNSPTFALMQEYVLPNNEAVENNNISNPQLLMHMDWYRLRDEEEAIAAGVENILEDERYRCWIEWPEKALLLLPKHYLRVVITLGEDTMERRLHATVVR